MEEKENHQHPRELSQDQPEPVSNSQLEDSLDNSNKVDTLAESEPVPQSILLPFSNISPLRSSNLQVTPPRTTRNQESSQDTSNLPWETMTNLPSSWKTPPLLLEVSFQTSTKNSSRSPRNELSDWSVIIYYTFYPCQMWITQLTFYHKNQTEKFFFKNLF